VTVIPPRTVWITRAGFEPSSISIQAGQSVRWVKSVQTVTVAADGSFSVTVRPLVNTVYVPATAKSHSDPLAISVRPSVRIGRIGHRRAGVPVSAARSFAHKYALLQYWRTRRSVWVTVGRVRLTHAVFGVSPTVTTRGVVRLHVRHRLRMRAGLPAGQGAPGYVSGFSNIIRS
jgi:hypothetical protein